LSPVGGKTITATFDGGKLSSNGGVLILREIERKLGLAAVLSRHIPDDRDHTRITHSYSDMMRARMFAIASGHEDCDDLDVLRSDPALKMACGRLPVSGADLMSQPTLSRLENAPFWRQLSGAACQEANSSSCAVVCYDCGVTRQAAQPDAHFLSSGKRDSPWRCTRSAIFLRSRKNGYQFCWTP
jgi:hypothetical protein